MRSSGKRCSKRFPDAIIQFIFLMLPEQVLKNVYSLFCLHRDIVQTEEAANAVKPAGGRLEIR